MGIPRTGARGALNILTAAAAIALGIDLSVRADDGAQTAGATLVVTVRSTAAARPPVRVTADVAVCGSSVADDSVVMTRGYLANAVVRLPGLKSAHPASVEVINEKCAFVPHVALAAPGAAIRMISRDDTLHTVHAHHENRSLFNVALPIPHVALSRPASGRGPVALRCNTHPWMSGFVYLTDDRAGITNRDGVVRFEGLPEGMHTVEVWHEVLGVSTAQAKLAAGRHTAVDITLAGK